MDLYARGCSPIITYLEEYKYGSCHGKGSQTSRAPKIKRLPGVLLNPDTKEVISCDPVDVSVGGLGIVSCEWVLPQVDVFLVVGNKKIAMEIVWSVERRAVPAWAQKSTDAAHQQVFRYGLKLASSETCDLTTIFESEGCFD